MHHVGHIFNYRLLAAPGFAVVPRRAVPTNEMT